VSFPFVIYRGSDGLVLRTGHCGDLAHVASQALAGEVADPSAPAEVQADGQWQWTSAGYVHSPKPQVDPDRAVQDLAFYASNILQKVLRTARPYTSGSTTIASDATSETITNWMALMQWASVNPTLTTMWVANDGTVTPLPASAINSIAFNVGGYSQSAWQDFAAVMTKINSGLITTTSQIDSATWPG